MELSYCELVKSGKVRNEDFWRQYAQKHYEDKIQIFPAHIKTWEEFVRDLSLGYKSIPIEEIYSRNMSISAGALWARENDIFFHDYGDNYFVLLVDGNRDTIVGSIGPSINSEMIVSYLAPLFHHLGENVPLHKSMIDYITHKINQRKIAYAGRWTQSRVNKIILIDRTNDFGLCMKYLIENAYNQLQKEFVGIMIIRLILPSL